MIKKTKILATLGPASDSKDSIKSLIEAGVNVFRMNFSHGDHDYHFDNLKKVREISKELGKPVGVLQDICGPKIRVGKLKNDFDLKEGDRIHFYKENILGYEDKKGFHTCINQPQILDMLKVDEYIYLYDGTIRTKVSKIKDEKITAIVQNSGKLASNKGVNFPNTTININVITKKDEKDIAWGIENRVDFIALSFVQNANDVRQLRSILDSSNSNIQVFSKIEKFDAVENIDEILEISDGLMVARGDLGIEVPYYKVPLIQKSIITKANKASKPVITATQMLLSMSMNEVATRAEISDVANAVMDGTDAVMLSEETAIGKNPVKAVEVMTNTIKQAEECFDNSKFDFDSFLDDTDIIARSTTNLATRLDVDAIISLTGSGKSAKKMARYRPSKAIYAVTHDERIARSLTIAWGIEPVYSIKKDVLNMMLASTISKGIQKRVINPNGTYIVTAGYPAGVEGSTNFIRIMRKNEIKYYSNFCKVVKV